MRRWVEMAGIIASVPWYIDIGYNILPGPCLVTETSGYNAKGQLKRIQPGFHPFVLTLRQPKRMQLWMVAEMPHYCKQMWISTIMALFSSLLKPSGPALYTVWTCQSTVPQAWYSTNCWQDWLNATLLITKFNPNRSHDFLFYWA